MILEEETFKKFGYYSRKLSYASCKRILAKCEICEKTREIRYSAYSDFCIHCSSKDRAKRIKIDNHPFNLITLCNKCHPKVEALTTKYIEQNRDTIEVFYDKWSKQ